MHDMRTALKHKLHEFINEYKIDLLIAENVLAIPMHVPLGLALTETIAETQLPTIAHQHDFFWERVRFSVNAVGDYIRMNNWPCGREFRPLSFPMSWILKIHRNSVDGETKSSGNPWDWIRRIA
jgi:hypothetical protein